MTTENINILTNRQKLWLKIFMGLGVLTFAISVFTDPTRAWLNLLLSGYFLTGIGFCGMMMVAILFLYASVPIVFAVCLVNEGVILFCSNKSSLIAWFFFSRFSILVNEFVIAAV